MITIDTAPNTWVKVAETGRVGMVDTVDITNDRPCYVAFPLGAGWYRLDELDYAGPMDTPDGPDMDHDLWADN